MENQFWKRELFPAWQRTLQQQDSNKWELKRNPRSSAAPPKETAAPPTGETVVAQQDSHKYELLYPYSLAAAAACALLILTLIVAYVVAKRRKLKSEDHTASSILIYPTQKGGAAPQFLTKEIHFSLPPLRSTSLDDLGAENPYDSDIDTDALLPPSVPCSRRSNSFSSYGLGAVEPALYKSDLDLGLDETQFGDGHIGRLWFSLRYEPSTEKLLVSLYKARNLPSRTVGNVNSCDPFVRLHLMPDERRYLQSKQKKKTCNPYFDETLVFQVSAKDMSDHILKLTVIDGGRSKRRGEIGHATFPLKDFVYGDGTEQQLFYRDLEKEVPEIKSDIGELLISLTYQEHRNIISATVIEARHLKFQGDKHDAYIRISLNQNCKTVKEKRTNLGRPLEDDGVSFMQGFNFKMQSAHLDHSLAFHVFQATSAYGRDKLIGKCVLGSYMIARGKALQHWTTAVANPMRQYQQWHSLAPE